MVKEVAGAPERARRSGDPRVFGNLLKQTTRASGTPATKAPLTLPDCSAWPLPIA
jgi:hypothetical protein